MDYDNASNVTLVTSQNGGTFEYGYDELNRVTSQTWTFAGRRYQTLLHYDSSGCLDTTTYPTGTVVTTTCDTANRVTSIRVGDDVIATDVVYHPSGQASAVTYGNGVPTAVAFDDRGRVKTVTAQGAIDLVYGYDGVDNVISIVDQDAPGSARTMTYDVDDRLRTVTADGLWGLAYYEYDELGNRKRKLLAADVQYTYDDSNRLVASTEAPDHGTLTFTWDDDGRLVSSSDGVTYRYDGHGRRVQKSEPGQTTVYHYDPSGRVIAETLPDGTKLRDYFYLGNRLIAVDGCVSSNTPPCSERQWYHTDTLGSAVARTDVSGTVVARMQYAPWGEEWSREGAPGDRQYNGRVYDPGTGFHDYGARMYWPQIGRFISADSYQGDIANPASLNRYSYVLNNPYKYVDPTGKWGEDVHRVMTTAWAASVGFNDADAQAIGQADVATDGGTWGGGTGWAPWGDQGYHFNTNTPGEDSRMEHFNADFARAVELGKAARLHREAAVANQFVGSDLSLSAAEDQESLALLGRALHALQDINAHTPDVTDDIMVGNQAVGKHHLFVKGVDNPSLHKEALQRTKEQSKAAMERYRDEVSR